MATYWVSSVNGNNANDGSTKALAKQYLYTDGVDFGLLDDGTITPVVGDDIYIDSAHSESFAVDTTITFTGDVPVYSINWTTEAYEFGAYIYTTGASIDLFITTSSLMCIVQGVKFEATGSTSYCYVKRAGYFHQCTFKGTRSTYGFSFGSIGRSVYDSCTFDGILPFSSVSKVGDLIFLDCTFINSTATYIFSFYNSSSYGGSVRFIGCDFTLCTSLTALFGTNVASTLSLCFVSGCKFLTGVSLAAGTLASKVLGRFHLSNCFSGTKTKPTAWIMAFQSGVGKASSDDTVYRVGGASIDPTKYSWICEPDATKITFFYYMQLPPIVKYVTAGSQSVVIYVASGVTLNDDDVWIEVESPSEASPADAQAKWRTTKPAPLVAATALTPDAVSAWSGIGVGTKQKIEVTIAPTEAGVVKITPFVATTSTLYIDPLVG